MDSGLLIETLPHLVVSKKLLCPAPHPNTRAEVSCVTNVMAAFSHITPRMLP